MNLALSHRVGCIVAGAGLMAVTWAATPALASGDVAAQALIERMQSAASSLSFSGTFVHQQDSVLQTSRIIQHSEGRQITTRLQALEGHRQEIVRTPAETRTYMPDRQMVKRDQTTQRRPVFPAMFTSNASLVMRNYDVVMGGSMRIADVDAQEVLFKPRHDHRWPIRAWIDKRTSLLVKCQKLDVEQRVIEQVAFTELNLSAKPSSSAMLNSAFAGARQWKMHDATMVSVASPVSLKFKPETLKGFELMSVLERASAPGSAIPFEVRRYVLTDGIALVSVFVYPKSPGGSSIDKPRRKGGQSLMSRETADAWLTVIGDVPPEVLGQFVSSIEWK